MTIATCKVNFFDRYLNPGELMPKQKTHSGAKDRFRVTRNGKVMHRKQNRNHLAEHKPQRRKLRLRADEPLASQTEVKNIKKMLGL